ncbi:MmcQ/YjbR family DNA-binding protein [Phytoactinopolyspora alkaliphila]|uniref:MmcQ/YjbR family DNA-binding protein n=1 Tax=Phytoactinopolyspora alkaliphila TaxID=1783498 RepID=A0A6N9YK82_9ACTN|nr:MmcQ/YjbR family DNA-binding protein [Phytoactinopolyspora alkaliphila]NED95347.1 MmcQ/YjbR family DNA-binding protein [Phytoactinopolyspora alkaliphila]
MSVPITSFLQIIDRLPEVAAVPSANYTTFKVQGRTFGYLWEETSTVGLKQTLAEQRALVAERPEVFEIQFTTPQYGWVVVYLDGIELDELVELTYEAWRLTASDTLVEAYGDRLPG